ncbi:MAG: hypothetical protein HC827_22840 [Cyanobacteria bacterium RM1_2_2]|nr:hypothetical protein [Cyanobacteria bacterium RM1_2_2]
MKFVDVLWMVPLALLGSGLSLALRKLGQEEKTDAKPDLEQKRGTDIVPSDQLPSDQVPSDQQPPASRLTPEKIPPISDLVDPVEQASRLDQDKAIEASTEEIGIEVDAVSAEAAIEEILMTPEEPEFSAAIDSNFADSNFADSDLTEPNLSAAASQLAEAEHPIADAPTSSPTDEAMLSRSQDIPDAAVDAITQANLTTIALYAEAEFSDQVMLTPVEVAPVEVASEAEIALEEIALKETALEEMPASQNPDPNPSEFSAIEPMSASEPKVC